MTGVKTKKVLVTINNNRLSGIERFVFLLSKYIDKERYDVTIAVPTRGPICDLFEENQIKYFVFDNRVNETHTLTGVLSLFRNILKCRYDIIHAQAGIAPCVIGKFLRTKLLVEHKHGLDFTTEQIQNMSIMKLYYERIKKYFVDTTITVCRNDKQTLIKRFNYDESKVSVVYNGLEDIQDFEDDDKGAGKKFVVGTIGRLTYQKGQEYFIKMAARLTSEGYDFDYQIFGMGEKFEDYKKLISEYNLEDKIVLKGYADDPEKALNGMDLFVLPSRYEGIPYVILEAMRAAKPLISTNVGGIGEIIQNGINGVLVEKENAEILAEKVKELWNSPELRNRISGNARKHFLENFLVSGTVKQIENIYS